MKLSELIEEATKALEEHGDIPVVAMDSGCGCCSRGAEFAGSRVDSDVWVYDHSSENGNVPLVFRVGD